MKWVTECFEENVSNTLMVCHPLLPALSLINTGINSITNESFVCFKHLVVLYLTHNKIGALQVNAFKGLDELGLKLGFNALYTLPTGIFDPLSKLERVYLQNNQLTHIQNDILNTDEQLVKVDLRNNRITGHLSTSLYDKQNLTFLLAGNNLVSQFVELNASNFGHERFLYDLDLSRNKIISPLSPEYFIGLVYLSNLRLFDNEITLIDNSTFDIITFLLVLDLGANYIQNLPQGAFSALLDLRKLFLNINELTTLSGDSFANLNKLELLVLSKNFISELTEGIFDDLVKLLTLYLDSNQLHTISTNIFYNLIDLVELDISDNFIASFPDVSHLSNLLYFFAQDNSIKAAPHDLLFNMENLNTINIGMNLLQQLSHDFFSYFGENHYCKQYAS